MKIIFSRKGFDSTTVNGGIPSPILPDGTLFSLPIPSRGSVSHVKYNDLEDGLGNSAGKLVSDLIKGNGKITPSTPAHFDPDLRHSMLPRLKGWKPLFGPYGPMHNHMSKHEVTKDDLILFFGWFREVEVVNGAYRFVRNAPNLHVLFGWFQIDQMLDAGPQKRRNAPKWAQYHPHFHNDYRPTNYVYVARSQLSLPGLSKKLPGGGTFEKYSDDLRLTAPAPNTLRRIWQLPRSIFPKPGQEILSYHPARKLWKRTNTHTRLKTQCIGQEFVLHADECPAAITWARRLIAKAA